MAVEIGRGQSVDPTADLAGRLATTRPTSELEAELEELAESTAYDDELAWEATPIDVGTTLDGEAWGWFRSRDGWTLLPLDFHAKAEAVLTATAWQSASMTGIMIGAGCRRRGRVALTWLENDIDGVGVLDVDYGADDVYALASGIAREVLEGFVECPGSDSGWEITVDTGPSLDDAAVGRLLTHFWKLCPAHEPGNGYAVVANGRDWGWEGDTWVPLDPLP